MGNSSFTRSALDPSSIIEAACKMATSSHEETTMSKSLSSFPLGDLPTTDSEYHSHLSAA